LIEEHEARARAPHERDLDRAVEQAAHLGVDADALIGEVARFSVAAPSWAVGTGGTRFGRFPGGGEPRTTEEKLDDVAALNALTGANRTISLHVPWDDPDDPAALRAYADDLGLGFDAMNSNTFQDNPSTTGNSTVSYKFGSFAHPDSDVRKHALEHNLAVVQLGVALGSTALTVWLGDGMNYPGQASFVRQFERVAEALHTLHDALPDDWEMFTEHKPYEPSYYASVNPDWGSSLLLAERAGPKTKCLVDLGHHLPGTNIEQVVSRLAMVGRLGGFHFNDSKYGDDDLTVGSINPYQFFLVAVELVDIGNGAMPSIRYMIDASHNLKDPIEDLIQATDQIQLAIAQALLVDRVALRECQDACDPAMTAEILQRAYRFDARPFVAAARLRNGAAVDPLATYRRVGYRAAVTGDRGSATTATGL
jgi:L-rhamnose isomerase/sugar isomerase